MKDRNNEPHICPKCGQAYTARPALSRADNSPICPDCGTKDIMTNFCPECGRKKE